MSPWVQALRQWIQQGWEPWSAPSQARKAVEEVGQLLQEWRAQMDRLVAERAELEAILQGMREGVLVLDSRGRIRMMNPALERMFHIRKEDCVGWLAIERLRYQPLLQFIQRVQEGTSEGVEEVVVHHPEERIFQVQASRVASRDQEGASLVLVFHDVTELRRLEQVRQDFLANASHELRTPMTSIKGYVEALLEGADKDPEKRREFLQILKRQTDRLHALITDLLTLSQLESREMVWRMEPIDVLSWLRRTLSLMEPVVTSRNQQLILDLDASVGTMEGDFRHLTLVITNLVDNASKYTPEGGRLGVEARGEPETIRITVWDEGMGIPSHALPRIFERFYRVDRARSRDQGGTGLGLSIVKHVVEAHGGSIDVESTPGRGSRFTVRLPRTQKRRTPQT